MTAPSEQTKQISTLTMNPSVDESSYTERIVPDDKLRCSTPEREPGGGGINVSRAVHKLGGRAPAFFTAGGASGEVLKRLVEEEGLEHHPLPVDDWTRSNLTVFEAVSKAPASKASEDSEDSKASATTEQQFRFVFPGSELREAEWQRCLDTVADHPTDYLVASGSLPPGVPTDFYARLARRCAECGVDLIVDASGEGLKQVTRAEVYLLKPNVRELQQLAGRSLEHDGDLEDLAHALIEQGACEVLVVSLGAGGAFLATRDRQHYIRTPAVPIRSKVGAGDSMVGGIVLGLARGLDLVDAVRFGVAAGAAAVMTPGTELCRRQDTEDLYTRIS